MHPLRTGARLTILCLGLASASKICFAESRGTFVRRTLMAMASSPAQWTQSGLKRSHQDGSRLSSNIRSLD